MLFSPTIPSNSHVQPILAYFQDELLMILSQTKDPTAVMPSDLPFFFFFSAEPIQFMLVRGKAFKQDGKVCC